MEFTISNRAKKTFIGLVAVGLIALVIGMITDHSGETGTRFWSNLLINGFFFFGISLGALFFLALQYATETAWFVVVKRVIEGVISWLPYGMGILTIVFLAATFHMNHIYHWMDPETYTEGSAHYDEIIANKRPYLNEVFFWIRTVAYFLVYYMFWKGFRNRSLKQDGADTTLATDIHFQNYKKGALFLVFFAVFSSTSSWDWLMSIDTHWFSTLFGWYIFAGMWCGAMIVIVALALYLKSKGHLENVNESHIHDLGKWTFAVSFLWSYLWFSQYMLIWYSNIPEESIYFVQRIEEYRFLFYFTFVINFAVPMLLLMSRDAKRNANILLTVCALIFIGHWLDIFLVVTPGTMYDHGGVGLLEIGMFLMFTGVFLFVILNSLTKAPLMVANDPYLDESLHHEI